MQDRRDPDPRLAAVENQLPELLLFQPDDERRFARAGVKPDQRVERVFANQRFRIAFRVFQPLRVGEDQQLARLRIERAEDVAEHLAVIPGGFLARIPRRKHHSDPAETGTPRNGQLPRFRRDEGSDAGTGFEHAFAAEP
ncbi:hypothetical protein SDC9_154467 [bioreactor metagenome]|uniref:Uncharacterized protein n=1 Tax=bioreactor metagenome TaxID=1076179 RepID=A0A645EYU2_9ZZZZ